VLDAIDISCSDVSREGGVVIEHAERTDTDAVTKIVVSKNFIDQLQGLN
jgi:hypothetical protein